VSRGPSIPILLSKITAGAKQQKGITNDRHQLARDVTDQHIDLPRSHYRAPVDTAHPCSGRRGRSTAESGSIGVKGAAGVGDAWAGCVGPVRLAPSAVPARSRPAVAA